MGVKKYKYEAAFSLLESLISLTILASALIPLNIGFLDQVKLNQKSEIRTGAAMIAQQVMDELRVEDPATMPLTLTSLAPKEFTMAAHTYSVVITYCKISIYCIDPTDTRHISIEISNNGKQIYETEAMYTQL